jgi:hypothetical protein
LYLVSENLPLQGLRQGQAEGIAAALGHAAGDNQVGLLCRADEGAAPNAFAGVGGQLDHQQE